MKKEIISKNKMVKLSVSISKKGLYIFLGKKDFVMNGFYGNTVILSTLGKTFFFMVNNHRKNKGFSIQSKKPFFSKI